MSGYAKNKIELARAVGLSRKGLERFFKMPDHPIAKGDGRHPVEEWREFVGERRSRLKANGSNGTTYGPNERERAMISKAEADAERTRFKLSVEQGKFLPRQDVLHQVEQANALVKRELNKALISELPPKLASCLSPSEMRKPLRRLAGDLCEQLSSQLMSLAAANNGASTAANGCA
jgi:hypothetical protein